MAGAERANLEDLGEDSAEGAQPGGVQSVDRAITVLEILSREGSAGVSEIAAEMGIHKSTASRLLGALVAREIVQQNRERGKYHLGFGILRLAASIPGRLSLVQEAGPVLQDLAAEFKETVNLAVLRSNYAVNVDQAMGPATIATQDWVGSLTPLHATASGKVLLAALPTEERQRILKETGLPAFTGKTVGSRPRLEEELLEVARSGVAFTDEEYEIGLRAVAVPVCDHSGKVLASVSISGPAFRFKPTEQPGLIEGLKQAGLEISRRMGYSPTV